MINSPATPFIILIPVYNDWESLSLLVQKIEAQKKQDYKIVVANDGSAQPCPIELASNQKIQIIDLIRNLGHQRAISIGLSFIYENYTNASVVVMDGDGEDIPEQINELIANSESTGHVSFARRTSRQEGIAFRILYYVYKQVFSMLTGKTINFGNFSFVPNKHLKTLVHVSEIWNNYPAGAIFSKIPISTIPLPRGSRLAGKSKMNHSSLIHHGLSAMSVHIESVAVRLLIFCLVTLLVLLGISGTVILLKLFTSLTSPGWATTIVFGCLTLGFQILALLIFFAFMTLSNRSNKKIIPIYDYKAYLIL